LTIHPSFRLCLGPDGWIYAVVRIDNETGFGSGYRHYLVRYNTKSRKYADLGVLVVKNPDCFDFVGKDGRRPPWSHGFHTLPAGHMPSFYVGRNEDAVWARNIEGQLMRPSGLTTRRFEAMRPTLAFPMPKCVTRRVEPSERLSAAAVRCTACS